MAINVTGYTIMRWLMLLAVSICSANAMADAVLLFETTKPRTPDTIHIKDSKIRLSNKADPVVTLFDYNKKRLTLLNQKDKTYYQITEKDLKKILKRLKKLQADMKRGLSPEQQAQLDKVFEKQGLKFNAAAIAQSVKKVKSSSVKGIDCDVYVTTINNQLHATHCVATARYLGINVTDFRTYLHLMHFLKKLSLGLDSIDPDMQNGFVGMPLITYDAKGNVISKFSSMRTRNVEKALFVVPDDYRQVGQP